MDEYLFISMAKLKADRLRLEREARVEEPAEELRQQPVETQRIAEGEPVMRATLTLAASVVINLVALGVLSWSVSESHLSPHGEVTITQLEQ